MKFDSHIKITNAALRLLKSRCPMPNACGAPLFKANPRTWVHDTKRSTAADNYIFGGLQSASYFFHRLDSLNPTGALLSWLFPNSLGDEVALVDINAIWTHEHPLGQRYHFMRANGETHYNAYLNALGFIHHFTEQWVKLAKERLKREQKDPLVHATQAETVRYQSQLALALHCLQDSFSTGHTVRSYGPDAPAALRTTGSADSAAPILELHDYGAQDHAKHADEDYASGGLDSGMGRVAVAATADLIAMGMVSITAPAGLVGWDAFVRKWLAERISRSASRAPLAAGHAH